jgi:hypothetical protein
MAKTTHRHQAYSAATLDQLAERIQEVASEYRGQIQPELSIINRDKGYGLVVIVPGDSR